MIKTYSSKTVSQYAPDKAYKIDNSLERCIEWWARVARADGTRDTVLHRTNGPAIEYDDGSQEWHYRGKLHRTDGPAVIDAVTGEVNWCINGEYITCYEDIQFLTRCSDEDIVMFKLRWGEVE